MFINELYDAMMVLNGTVVADDRTQAYSREIFVEQAEHLRKHNIARLWDVYGAKEMTCSGLTKEDVENELVAAQLEAAAKFVPCEHYKNSLDFRKHWTTYINFMTANGVRRMIERYNSYSPYYASRLLALKVDGYLDLDEITVEEAAKCWNRRSTPPKDPEMMLNKLKDMGKLRNHAPLDEAEDCSVSQEDVYGDIELRAALDRVKASMLPDRWAMFEEYYLSDNKPTLKAMSLRHHISQSLIKTTLKSVADEVRDYLTGKKLAADDMDDRFWADILM